MRNVGYESSKSELEKQRTGFWDKYLTAPGLDIGYRGGIPNAEPIAEDFIGVELGYPGTMAYTYLFLIVVNRRFIRATPSNTSPATSAHWPSGSGC